MEASGALMPRARKRCGIGQCDEVMPCTTHNVKKRPPGRYPASHHKEREAWKPAIAAGQVHCRRGEKCRRYPNTLIVPGKPWHLGHPDEECDAPTAPEHAACNTSAPGRLR